MSFRNRSMKSVSAPKPTDTHEMSGQLHKMGVVNRSWKERWFVLSDKKLFYYKNQKSTNMIHFISLESAYVRTSEEFYPESPCFDIVTPQRVFQLVAPNYNTMKEWMMCIQSYSTIVAENDKIRSIDDRLNAKAKTKNELELETLDVTEPSGAEDDVQQVADSDEPTLNEFDDETQQIQPTAQDDKEFETDTTFKRMQRMQSVFDQRSLVTSNVQ